MQRRDRQICAAMRRTNSQYVLACNGEDKQVPWVGGWVPWVEGWVGGLGKARMAGGRLTAAHAVCRVAPASARILLALAHACMRILPEAADPPQGALARPGLVGQEGRATLCASLAT